MTSKVQLEPPDGGWGILICIGMAFPFISGLSALPSFGLVFGDFLKSIGAETSTIAFITSFFFCALSFSGLFSGSLFNRFGMRTVGLCGAILYFVGSIAQIFVNSAWTLTISFSILQGAGFGLMIPTSYTTFNNYFVKKRIMWMSFAQSLIGLGCMLYPVLMQKLRDWYGFRGCLIVLAAINAHVFLGMLLMQPVEWHMRKIIIEENGEQQKFLTPENISSPLTGEPPSNVSITRKDTFVNCEEEILDDLSPLEHDSQKHSKFSKEDLHICSKPLWLDNQNHSKLSREDHKIRSRPLEHDSKRPSIFSKEEIKIRSRRSSSIISLGNWTGPIIVSDASPQMTRERAHSIAISSMKNETETEESKLSCWEKTVDFLGLTLLKSPVYVNIVLGISFALYSDIAFFTIQPLYLFELNFSKPDTASIIAIGAASDLASRLFLAFSAVFIQMPSRYIYLAGSFFTIIARFGFLSVLDFTGMAYATAILGFFRTWLHVPLPLVFAEYLPKERFAAGYGLFMFLHGNILFLIGPIVGYLRDVTQNYVLIFHILNFFMTLCAFPWIIEMICIKFRRKQKITANI